MVFDEPGYRNYLKALRGRNRLPDDLLARYAIVLPATDAQVAAQLKSVRSYWNQQCRGGSPSAQVVKLCQAEDERMKAEFGALMETAKFWDGRQGAQRSSTAKAVEELVRALLATYGPLGIVTKEAVARCAAQLDIGGDEALSAIAKAKLRIAPSVAIPESEPIPSFRTLVDSMGGALVSSIPELVHPGCGPFRIVSRFECVSDATLRLDERAVTMRIAELDKARPSKIVDAHRAAMRLLLRACKEHIDLRDVALYHLAVLVGDLHALPTGITVTRLEKAGVEHEDAVVMALTIADRQGSGGSSGGGLQQVRDLLAQGCLADAAREALAMAGDAGAREEAAKEVDGARARLGALLAEARHAAAGGDEAAAAAFLRQAAAISPEDAAQALAVLPVSSPVEVQAVCVGATVKLSWRRAADHDEETGYMVIRREDRPPGGVPDGTVVSRGSVTACTDTKAPVARLVYYGVVAVVDGRPHSRPACTCVMLLPVVEAVQGQAGPNDVAIEWSLHPSAQGVRVRRRTATGTLQTVAATRSSCHVLGLPEGQSQHFEIAALYTGKDGTQLASSPEHFTATPRPEATPVMRLRVRLVDAVRGTRVRVAWRPTDSSEVRIFRSASSAPWSCGDQVSNEDMVRFGQEMVGQRVLGRSEESFETDMPPGIHYVVPFSLGGTGIIVGQEAVVGMTLPVSNVRATAFDTYATVSWEWPRGAQRAEVAWEVDGIPDTVVVGVAQYRAQGGVRVPLGRNPCTIEVRAVVLANGTSFTSSPTTVVVERVVDATIAYTVSSGTPLGLFGRRAKKVVFMSTGGHVQAQVQVVVAAGHVLPSGADGNIVLLDAALVLAPGASVTHRVDIPVTVKRPYWVRCFVVDGRARLIDPPISALKDA